MGTLRKKRSKKAGLPPGTPIHIGEHKTQAVLMTAFSYTDSAVQETVLPSQKDCLTVLNNLNGTLWIQTQGIHDIQALEQLASFFQLHPLVLEDIVNNEQRPKLEDYSDYLFVVIKQIKCHGETRRLRIEQLSFVLGPHFILSFQEDTEDVFQSVIKRLRNEKGRLRTRGVDYLTYALIDAIVDHYFEVLENFGSEIEELEPQLISEPNPSYLKRLHHLKQDMVVLRKSIWPLREVLSHLERRESRLIDDKTRVYFRDIHDHTVQIIETLETYRDMLSNMLDIYLTSLSHKLNETMKVMAIIATLFIPLTLIAGIYGMNFKHMPELDWPWGYPFVLIFMGICAGGMLIYFRKKRWL